MDSITVGFIGFGLIGGSIAHALKELNPKNTLLAYQYSNYSKKPSSGLLRAKDDQILDIITEELTDFSACDIIFLCAPVLSNISYLSQLKSIIKSNCIITDVGSVKGNIHTAALELELDRNFIGGHPMAGSEKTGYESSSGRLLENAYYILSPTDLTPPDKLEFLRSLVVFMGAIPVIINAGEHDDITAAISHVPHIIAAALVNMVKDSDDPEEKMKTLAAGGFKDITRIASSSPVMWQNICLTNTDSIKRFLKLYIASLEEVSDALSSQDASYLFEFFETAGDYRDSLPVKVSGLINRSYEIYLDIIDEAGAIATVATLLATNSISIKNIGIIHNREFEQGVLRIEFYEEEACNKASLLLKKYRYTVYER